MELKLSSSNTDVILPYYYPPPWHERPGTASCLKSTDQSFMPYCSTCPDSSAWFGFTTTAVIQKYSSNTESTEPPRTCRHLFTSYFSV